MRVQFVYRFDTQQGLQAGHDGDNGSGLPNHRVQNAGPVREGQRLLQRGDAVDIGQGHKHLRFRCPGRISTDVGQVQPYAGKYSYQRAGEQPQDAMLLDKWALPEDHQPHDPRLD